MSSKKSKKGFGLNPKHRGLFTKWCKRHGFSGPTTQCINKAISVAKQTGNNTLLRRAVFARNAKNHFKKMK